MESSLEKGITTSAGHWSPSTIIRLVPSMGGFMSSMGESRVFMGEFRGLMGESKKYVILYKVCSKVEV
jgi:hypothetical protein